MDTTDLSTLDRAVNLCHAVLGSAVPDDETNDKLCELGHEEDCVDESRSANENVRPDQPLCERSESLPITVSENTQLPLISAQDLRIPKVENTLTTNLTEQSDTFINVSTQHQYGETSEMEIKTKTQAVISTGNQFAENISELRHTKESETFDEMEEKAIKEEGTDGTINEPNFSDGNRQLLQELAASRTELEVMRKRLATAERKLEKADNYNDILRKMVESLSAQIHQYKMKTSCKDGTIQVNFTEFSTDKSIQLDEADFLHYTTGEMLMPDWGTPGLDIHVLTSKIHGSDQQDIPSEEGTAMSIAESLKATAEAVVAEQSGFTFDAASGLYYDQNTGYYYDPNSQLYYDPTNCTYFYYDHESGNYTLHSQVSDEQQPVTRARSTGTKPKPKTSKSKTSLSSNPATVTADPALVADKCGTTRKPTLPNSSSKSEKPLKKTGLKNRHKSADNLNITDSSTGKEFKNRKERREALRKEIEELTRMRNKIKKQKKRAHSEKRRKHRRSDQSEREDDRHRKPRHKHKKRRLASCERDSRDGRHRKHKRHKREKLRKEKDYANNFNSKSKKGDLNEYRNNDLYSSVDTIGLNMNLRESGNSADSKSNHSDAACSLTANHSGNSTPNVVNEDINKASEANSSINDAMIVSVNTKFSTECLENETKLSDKRLGVNENSILKTEPSNMSKNIIGTDNDRQSHDVEGEVAGVILEIHNNGNKNKTEVIIENIPNSEVDSDKVKTEYGSVPDDKFTLQCHYDNEMCIEQEAPANRVDEEHEEAMDVDDGGQHLQSPSGDKLSVMDEHITDTADYTDDEDELRATLHAKMKELMEIQCKSEENDENKQDTDKSDVENNCKYSSKSTSEFDSECSFDIDNKGGSSVKQKKSKTNYKSNERRRREHRRSSSCSPRGEGTFGYSKATETIDRGEKTSRRQQTSRYSDSDSDSLSDVESGELSSSESGKLSIKSGYEEVSDSSVSSESDSDDGMEEISTEEEEEDDESDVEEEESTPRDEVSSNWPPCVRMIVTEAQSVDVGTLFIVTCDGGTVGRTMDTGHAVLLNEPNVSKMHAEIRFLRDVGHYKVNDLGSQNGTFINSRRVEQKEDMSNSLSLSHGDVVEFGSTKLLCHIHSGTNTCDDCEPGVVRAQHRAQHPQQDIQILSKSEKKTIHRQELKQIKHKYGLKDAAYVDNLAAINNPKYSDKAGERRRKVGSDTPNQKQEAPTSVHRPLSSGNVGHKMLKKMGWKEGESLGKDNSGIQEPVTVDFRANQSAGLGSGTAAIFSADDANSVDVKKVSRRIQAQQRYNKLQSVVGVTTTEHPAVKQTWNKGDTFHPD